MEALHFDFKIQCNVNNEKNKAEENTMKLAILKGTSIPLSYVSEESTTRISVSISDENETRID